MPRTLRRVDLHAAHEARQRQVARRADALADAAGRAVERAWRGILMAIRRKDVHAAHMLLRALPAVTRSAIDRALRKHHGWAHAAAVECARGCVGEQRRGSVVSRHKQVAQGYHGRGVRESFDWDDLLAPFRALFDDPDATDADADPFADVLFPAPTPEQIDAVLYGSGWRERIRSGTGLGSPDAMAARIATGLMLGKNHQEIARDILPAVEGVRSSARRIARTEALRVAAATQMDAHQQLGDLVIGYQVHATLDANTRPWHRERDGTKYYLDPGPNQKSMYQCPQPPDEAPDPAERPAGAPATAWNCRCHLVPILRD